MQSITIVLRAKQLINASKQSNVTTCHSVIQDLLGNNPVMWPVSSLPWVIAGLIHCMDRLPLSTLDTIMPSVFELFAKLLDNEWSHPIMIKGLRLAHRPPRLPQRFLVIPRIIMAIKRYRHYPEAFDLAQRLLALQSQTNDSELFQGLLPIHCKQLQAMIAQSHKTPLSAPVITSLELMAHSFPVAFDQLIAPLPRRTKHRVLARLSVKWPRGWVAESRHPRVVWWQRLGVAVS